MTSKNDIFQSNACELIDFVKSRKISITEMIESHLERIEQLNPELNAIINYNPSQSLDTARILDSKKEKGIEIGLVGENRSIHFRVKNRSIHLLIKNGSSHFRG